MYGRRAHSAPPPAHSRDVLSKQRANGLQAALVGDPNNASVTFEVRSHGEQYPIADSPSEAGRKEDRREVTLRTPASTNLQIKAFRDVPNRPISPSEV
ncbi:hypothetical protein CP966_26740 [Streptomyces galilaeus]|nr:hypothetical protein CP966_26740 [Streptomyces galilaeus]GGW72656.1 hypothetical protein GCM10010350_66560 [Streptomyces galilaeus]